MKTILVVLMSIVLFLSLGCKKAASTRKSTTGAVIEVPKAQVDGWTARPSDVPSTAKNVVYLGKGWYTFELDGTKFLLRNHGHYSAMAAFDSGDS